MDQITELRAFVAGATGYTGQHVVAELVRREVHTVAHVRPDSSRLEDHRTRFTELGAAVDTTAWEPAAMEAALAELRPTHVLALLGTTRARMSALAAQGKDPAEASYEAVDYGLSALLLQASVATGCQPRFVYLSAAGVREGNTSAYYTVRWRLEQELRDSGLPFVIARPSFITGEDRDEDRPLERLGAAAVDAALFVAGTFGATRLQHRYRSNTATVLARSLVRLALDPDAVDQIVESEALHDPSQGEAD